MKNSFLFILLLNFALSKLYAQHEANNWYFGYYAGMNFSGGSPVALTNGSLISDEGCSTISDNAGNLLFYTNGENVWDRNHQLMPNGAGLLGQTSVTQSCLIVKRPGWSGRYFIFTIDIFYTFLPDEGLNYSEVDMSLNGGFGDILTGTKNINLIPDSLTEKLCGVRNANGIDIWVLVHPLNTNSFYAYSVTSSGVNSSPVISNVGSTIGVSGHAGQMKFSISGNKLAVATNSNRFELFDFNTLTGVVSNPLVLMSSDYNFAYGVEFSPDETKLYVSNWDVPNDSIYQYNLAAGNDSLIIESKTSLGSVSCPNYVGQMQLAPDGKIYIVKSLKKLSVINNPNNLGLSCNLVVNGFTLISPGENSGGLPNFVSSYLLPTSISENNLTPNYSIFPNPFTDKVSITVQNQNFNQAIFQIRNILGQTVVTRKENNWTNKDTRTIDLSFLSNGIYLLDAIIDGERTVKKIVKE